MAELLGKIASRIRDGSSAAHAYIIQGGSSQERGEKIRLFAADILCENPKPDGSRCGECGSCRRLEAGTNMDVIYMECSGKSGYTADDATAFSSRIAMGAYGSRVVGIIEDAEKLSEIVQNKLLKTLEEPEDDVVIILGVASEDSLLSTVRSRCMPVRIDTDELSAGDELQDAVTLAEEMMAMPFYRYRESVDKKLKSREDAAAFLDGLEEIHRTEMTEGREMKGHAEAIELIEKARMDIARGMQYGKALKRLYLELAE